MKLSKNAKNIVKILVLLEVAVQFGNYTQSLLEKFPHYPMDTLINIVICMLVTGFTGYFLSLVFWDNEK
jgi:hypothetical protein